MRVKACGVCGSDFHFVDGTAHPRQVPVTLGHEVAGHGGNQPSTNMEPGDDVIALAGLSCGCAVAPAPTTDRCCATVCGSSVSISTAVSPSSCSSRMRR